MSLSKVEELKIKDLMCTFLVLGENAAGEEIYAVVAVKAEYLPKIMTDFSEQGFFNPIDYAATILTHGAGEPGAAILQSLETQKHFSESEVFLNLSKR